ncbi:MAG: tRNA uracil 4-sulfurtransferase ThiI [Coriobacteriia bacterium]|nr:tRNA uracil 4-sulfurtransferase ThiI [Coriobacteriia bacterium]
MEERVCFGSYHEIGLKGRNRSVFERRLADNLTAILEGLPVARVERMSSRIVVPVTDHSRVDEVAVRMALVPGVNTVMVATRIERDLSLIEQAALAEVAASGPFTTFAVDAKRSNTEFPHSSQEMNRILGSTIQAATGAGVDLGNPDLMVTVVVAQAYAYVSTRRYAGVGGLPTGMSGTLVSLLSSGIDSPVATWRMMRRGAVAVGLHFSGRPHVSSGSEELVARIASVLEQNGGLGRVYVVPFGDIQKEISLLAPPDLRIILYRRLMMRIAAEIAGVERAKAIVTGESLGQVASQTLENIAAVDEASELPVFRPLIGNDKLEIMAEARRIGTYEISIEDAPDCCTLFMPRTPETHASPTAVREAWNALPHERMVADALEALEWLDFRCPTYRPPKRWPTPAGAPGFSVAAMRG